jgi:hypothetical protein
MLGSRGVSSSGVNPSIHPSNSTTLTGAAEMDREQVNGRDGTGRVKEVKGRKMGGRGG